MQINLLIFAGLYYQPVFLNLNLFFVVVGSNFFLLGWILRNKVRTVICQMNILQEVNFIIKRGNPIEYMQKRR